MKSPDPSRLLLMQTEARLIEQSPSATTAEKLLARWLLELVAVLKGHG